MSAPSMSAADAVTSFVAAMTAAGIEPAEPIANKLASGELVRFTAKGEKRANSWARLYLDERPAGAFGNWREGSRHTWSAGGERVALSAADRLAFHRKVEADREARSRELTERQEAVAAQATSIIASAAPADAAYPYLVRKRVSPEGLCQLGNVLLVPMRDAAGRVWNVQRIFPDGAKRFLTGGRTKGLFWLVGGEESPLCIGEGLATVKAVRRATGYSVAAAFSAGNLEAVALALRARWPVRPMILCADDDAHLVHHPRIRRNVGTDAARAAAALIGAKLALPVRSVSHD